MPNPSQKIYEFGIFSLNPVERTLLRGDELVPLPPKTFDVLLALVERRGHLIEKEDLIQMVWPNTFVEEANLSRHVFTLRRALNDGDRGFRFIETVPRRGYRFVATVTETSDEPAELIVEERTRSRIVTEKQEETGEPRITTAVEPQRQVPSLTARRWMVAGLVAVFTVVIATVIGYAFFNRAPALTDRDSVLLADFANTTGDEVFDDTLRQALATQLEQSPFLNIFPDAQVRETLRLMKRSPDERVTQDIAREICLRQGIKASLAGAITKLDRHYVITLEAINAQTGEAIAREVEEAEDKDRVLKSLGSAATKLREKLGESLSIIQKFDAPIDQATTSSLEAYKAYSLGLLYQRQAKYAEAIQLHQRAIQLDPNFALAYARLSSCFINQRESSQATHAATKAFDLRERVSERERYLISWQYYWEVLRDFDEQQRLLEVWKSVYPRDPIPLAHLGISYALMGQHERAIEEYREAIRLDSHSAQTPHNLATSLMTLGRFEEARQPSNLLPGPQLLYWIAFVEGDAAEMERQIEVMINRDWEPLALNLRAGVEAFYGRISAAQQLTARAIDLAQRRNRRGVADTYASGWAMQYATLGNQKRTRAALSLVSDPNSSLHTFFNVGLARAQCGDVKLADSMIHDRIGQYPGDRVVNEILCPLIKAAIEIQRGNCALAIRILEENNRYKAASELSGVYQAYLLGNAYLCDKRGAEATIEFQYILDHRGQAPSSVLYPLAHLGLARAAKLSGNAAESRKSYERFLDLWKDADPDLAILIEARKEYKTLK